ncbi:protease modulator HflC [Thiohalobacter sp. IOR34]|uniref:protease modulator HflC n=1 Tax=Thiohalobacter sp. IOR34 TaxID=3057176 RepID=UPI0025B0DD03|nr:protease modulator HflC [Thiohalobacter sp. IOR34]WJW74819.1 protease modulator HflC [Thiohalobacter sp. IOR34]
MNALRLPSLILLLLAAVGAWMSMFVVDERERAILFHLGEIVRSDYEPGLHFMVPIYNNVKKFDRRILTLDAKPEQVLTGEKKNVLVDYFVKWRISDVESFYRSFGGREIDAASTLAQTIKDGLQAELGNRTIKEVVSGERKEIMASVARRAGSKVSDFGIEIIDFRIKQIELPSKVAGAVFQRMRAERERVAKEHRARGEKESLIIRARADRLRTEILAAARRKADEIRGAGDAQATEIYAEAYGRDPAFYGFYRSMEAYRTAFSSKQDVMVLEPDNEFFRFFADDQGRR